VLEKEQAGEAAKEIARLAGTIITKAERVAA
jgi:hypothetical protein